MLLCVFWISLYHFILCASPPLVQLTTTQVTDLCKKGNRGEQVLYRLGICYYHSSDKYAWHDAIQTCESRNTHLIHLETTEEQDFITQNTGGTSFRNEIWLGLKKNPKNNWVWFYNDKQYPILHPRWSTSSPRSPRPPDVAQTFRMRTWAQTNKDQRLEVVCEDPLPPELTKLFCVNHPTASIAKWGPLPNFHCYYYIGMKSYTQAKTECEMASTHLIFLETEDEESWIEKELRVQQIPRKYWLGIEKNDTDHWNWRYRKLSQHEANPRFKPRPPSSLTYAIVDNKRDGPGPDSDLEWEEWPKDRMEKVICEEDIYPKLISELLCYRHAGEVTGIFNPTNNHCYYVYIEEVRFRMAKRACERREGYLATFENTEEQLFVENEAYNSLSSYTFWLGLRREDNGDWYWLGRDGTKTLVEDDRWETDVNVEDGGDGHAVTVEDGEWAQATRVDTFPFICEEEYDNEFVIHYRVCTKFVRDAIPVFNYETRSCYYLFDNTTDWRTARETCGQSQTYVVHPDTDKEQAWLASLVTDFDVHESVWIGIESRVTGQWSWRFANHAEVTENTRFTDNTNGGGNNGKMLSDGTWERVTRNSLSGLICEESISPLGIQEAERVNVGSIVYVTQNILESEGTTTSMDSTTIDSTTLDTVAEDTSKDLTTTEDLTTNEDASEDLTTTEVTAGPDITTGGPAHKDLTTVGASSPEPDANPEATPEDPESSASSYPFRHPSISRPPMRSTAITPTTSIDATSLTDTASSSVMNPDSPRSSDESLRSSEISPHTISSSMAALDAMQTIQPTSGSVKQTSTPYPSTEHLTSTHQTPDGDWGDEVCPNADSYSGGYVIETPYKRRVLGHYKNISKIATFSRASNLRCAKQCSLNPDCRFYTRDESKTCILYQFFYGSLESVDCAEGTPCYFKACNLYGGA